MPTNRAVRRLIMRRRVVAGSSLDAATTAWVAAVVGAGGSVSVTQQGYVDTLIKAYKAAPGVWSLLDHEWLYASENAVQASIDIVGLSVHTLVNDGNLPTFTANQGYQAPGADGHISLGLAPSGGTNFTTNANSFGGYIRTSRTSGGAAALMGTTTGGADITYLRTLNGSNAMEFDDNAATFPTGPANTNAQGNYIISRTNSSTIVPYRNASTLSSVSSATGSRSTQNWFVLGYNNNGAINSNTSDQVASVFVGGVLDGTQAPAKNVALNAYMTSVGANVY